MVRIAVAGGTGQVAREVIDALQATHKHDVLILSRTKASAFVSSPSITWRQVDYNDDKDLISALQGVHTVLSFIQPLSDADQKAQKNLIDIAVRAGVKRFAPSEYGRGTTDMPWWDGKEVIREYLREINAEKQVLEFTLFQPGMFLDYLAFPHKTAKYVEPLQTVFDFDEGRAIMLEGHENAIITFTTVADLAALVAYAVDYDKPWPTTCGIRGNQVTFSQILDIGRKIRGRNFTVEKVKIEDLEAGELKTSWELAAVHQAVPNAEASAFLKNVVIGILLSSAKGAWDVSDEMNQLFPDYELTTADNFLRTVWDGG